MESARRSSRMMLSILLFLALAISSSTSSYFITFPMTWFHGKNEICVSILDEEPSGGDLEVHISVPSRKVYRTSTRFEIKEGTHHECFEMDVSNTDGFEVRVFFNGNIGGSPISGEMVAGWGYTDNRTFIQTDKHLYKPGQQVQFRILTVYGREAQVSTEEYPEVYVTTPSKARIAQWNNVDNSAGIVQLAFKLADEPEKGQYKIILKNAEGQTITRSFKVDEYVLPRFEVTVTPPKVILVTDTKFTFRVCAKYTFGQPVRGNLTVEFSNQKKDICLTKHRQSLQITGCADIEVASVDVRIMDCEVENISATAIVEEEGTGVTMNATGSTNVERTPVKFNIVHADKYKKPNLPYFVEVQAMLHNNMPARELPLEVCIGSNCTKRTTDSDGFVRMALVSENTDRILMSSLNCGAMQHSTTYSRDIKHQFSPSNSSLQILAPKGKLKCLSREGSNFSLDIMYSARDQPSATLNIQVNSRGKEHLWVTKRVDLKSSPLPVDPQDVVDGPDEEEEGGRRPEVTGMLSIPITIPPTASYTVQVIVWYTRSDGEVVADSAKLEVEKCLPNHLDLKWSSEQGQPGDLTSFTLSGEPNSICSVGVVDRSTELLHPPPDPINLNRLFDHLQDTFNITLGEPIGYIDSRYCKARKIKERAPKILPAGYYYTWHADSIHMFIDSGLFVFSDLDIQTRPCEAGETWSNPLDVYDSDKIMPEFPRNEVTQVETIESESARTKFPETWLWNIVVLPDTGVLKEEVTLPDTITEWAGTAVCAHPEKGVGVSEQASITTFTPFFADLTLPPSIKRGEILPVKISVFNYLKEALPVTVTLFESPEYEVVEDETTGDSGNQRHTCLRPQDKAVHTIKIRTLAIGDVNLTVLAHTDAVPGAPCRVGQFDIYKRDMLIKPIKVEAEGFLREVTQSEYVCVGDEDASPQWEMVPPSNIVPDSERGWVNVLGDLLTLSLENLGSLIRMPYGCGEQNMIKFAPNIFIMQYLNASNQNNSEAEEKLLRFMKSGYQRQLRYQREDGSFSAFGDSDDSGSTWLTAFVLKSFAQAKDFIYVDDSQIYKATAYLYSSQTDDDGCIIHEGKLLQKGLKGGLAERNSSVSMTAYITAALLESGSEKQDPIVKYGIQCLLQDSSRDPYTVALKAYAMALAGNPQVKNLLKQLRQMAVKDIGIHWNLESENSKGNSLAVETAGYFILATLTHNPSHYGPYVRKVVKWITTQRNGQGGFYSTQDTVVALQAMAKYETLTSQRPLNVVATVTAQGSLVPFKHQFVVNENSKLLQQQKTIPSFPTTVEVALDGQGCVVMQAVLRYNIPEPEASNAFSLSLDSQNSLDGNCTRKRIKVCVSYLLPDGKSNMGVIEVNLVSGYIPEKEDLKEAVRNSVTVKRYEVDRNKVSFYVDEFTADELCISFRIVHEVKIEDTKPGSVVVYDYYQPEFAVSESYSFPSIDGC